MIAGEILIKLLQLGFSHTFGLRKLKARLNVFESSLWTLFSSYEILKIFGVYFIGKNST